MDVRIDKSKEHFKFRVCGILTYNEKVLAVKIGNNKFYCLPGGHAEIGEDTITATKREMKEELDFEIEVKNLKCMAENIFYTPKNELMHELSFYYEVEATDPTKINTNNYERIELDKGEYKKLEFIWIPKSDISKFDFRPKFLAKVLNTTDVCHIINKFDEADVTNFIKND